MKLKFLLQWIIPRRLIKSTVIPFLWMLSTRRWKIRSNLRPCNLENLYKLDWRRIVDILFLMWKWILRVNQYRSKMVIGPLILNSLPLQEWFYAKTFRLNLLMLLWTILMVHSNIKNDYIQTPSSEKHYIYCDPEFGLEHVIKVALI